MIGPAVAVGSGLNERSRFCRIPTDRMWDSIIPGRCNQLNTSIPCTYLSILTQTTRPGHLARSTQPSSDKDVISTQSTAPVAVCHFSVNIGIGNNKMSSVGIECGRSRRRTYKPSVFAGILVDCKRRSERQILSDCVGNGAMIELFTAIVVRWLADIGSEGKRLFRLWSLPVSTGATVRRWWAGLFGASSPNADKSSFMQVYGVSEFAPYMGRDPTIRRFPPRLAKLAIPCSVRSGDWSAVGGRKRPLPPNGLWAVSEFRRRW